MGFRPSAQYCKNVGTLIQCGESERRVIYSKSTSSHESDEPTRFLDEILMIYLALKIRSTHSTNDSLKNYFLLLKLIIL
jgi:hypothetical protein